MDFKDISARFKQKKAENAPPPPPERDYAEFHAIRARILGVLLRDARLTKNATLAQAAAALHIDEATLQNWEFGNSAPSLPQLEVAAFYYDVPISHFWGREMLSAAEKPPLEAPAADYYAIRDRVIGIRLAMARKEARLSQEELGKAAGLTAGDIVAFESGQQPIPLPVLWSLAYAVQKSVGAFVEDIGRLGGWLALQEQYDRFSQLPPELRAFISQPTSQPFLEIAMRLSQLPLEELRTVGEKILDITL